MKRNLIEQYFAAWKSGNWDELKLLLAEDFSFESPMDRSLDLAAFHAKCWPLHRTFTGIIPREMFESGDLVCVTYRHAGSEFEVAEVFRFSGNKIAGIKVYFGSQFLAKS